MAQIGDNSARVFKNSWTDRFVKQCFFVHGGKHQLNVDLGEGSWFHGLVSLWVIDLFNRYAVRISRGYGIATILKPLRGKYDGASSFLQISFYILCFPYKFIDFFQTTLINTLLITHLVTDNIAIVYGLYKTDKKPGGSFNFG